MTVFRRISRDRRGFRAGLAGIALLSSVAVATGAGVAAAATGAPTGLTPNDTVPHKNPILRWTPVEGAGSYQVQVSPDPAFTGNLAIDEPSVPIPQLALPTGLPHASYFWHVRAAPVTGTPGPWSGTASITRGWTDKPSGLAYDKTLGRFTWSAIPDASAYEIEFSSRPDFPLASATPAADAVAASDAELPLSGTGALRVDGVGVADGDLLLLKRQVSPSTASAGNGVYRATVTAFSYVLAKEAVGSREGDLVHISGGPTASDALWSRHGSQYSPYSGSNSCVVNHPAYSFETQPAGKVDVTGGSCLDWPTLINPERRYYWRVRGRAGTDTVPGKAATDPGPGCVGPTYENSGRGTSATVPECSLWSPAATFGGTPTAAAAHLPSGLWSAAWALGRTELAATTSPPAAPAAVKAVGDCTGGGSAFTCGDTPSVQWAAVPGAASYATYVALDADLTDVRYLYDSPKPSVSPTGSWPDNRKGGAYSVAVQACTATHACGPLTAISVAKHSDPVTLLRPVTTAHPLNSTNPSLVWTDFLASGGHGRQEVRNYRVQVARDSDFRTPLEDVTIDREGDVAGRAEYTSPNKVYPDGTLYWRVAPVDDSRNLLTWSATATFVKDASGATATITSPNGAPILGPIAVTFSQPVTGVSSTSLRLLLAATSAPVPATVSVLSGTTASIEPRARLVTGGVYRLAVAPSVKDATGNSAKASATTVRTATVVSPGSSALVERWETDPSPNAYGGAYEKSATLNDVAALNFTGTLVSLSGTRSTSGGYGHVYVDGAYTDTVSFYAPATVWRSTIWTSKPLADGPHNVRVYVTATREASSRGNYVYIDQWTVGTATYQEASGDTTQHAYDAWSRQVATDATGRTADVEMLDRRFLIGELPTAKTVVAGATVVVKLCRTPKAGFADIYVDHSRRIRVSLFQSYTSCGYAAYSAPLTPGVHSVVVRVTGILPTGSKGSAVGLDAISVT